jgi:hypothetical protein
MLPLLPLLLLCSKGCHTADQAHLLLLPMCLLLLPVRRPLSWLLNVILVHLLALLLLLGCNQVRSQVSGFSLSRLRHWLQGIAWASVCITSFPRSCRVHHACTPLLPGAVLWWW